jgi:hypothetical protein
MNLWKIKIKLDQQKKKQFEMLVSDFWVWNNTWVNYVLIEIEARTAASKQKWKINKIKTPTSSKRDYYYYFLITLNINSQFVFNKSKLNLKRQFV